MYLASFICRWCLTFLLLSLNVWVMLLWPSFDSCPCFPFLYALWGYVQSVLLLMQGERWICVWSSQWRMLGPVSPITSKLCIFLVPWTAVGEDKSAPFHQDWICENRFIWPFWNWYRHPRKQTVQEITCPFSKESYQEDGHPGKGSVIWEECD